MIWITSFLVASFGFMRAFDAFIQDVTRVVRGIPAPADLVTRVEPLLRRLVEDRSWLAPRHQAPLPHKPYAQYLLYRPADSVFSVVSFVWNPSQGSPIHDHCTWGVVGQYEGDEEETRYRRVGSKLEAVRTVVVRTGDVSHVYPPDRDIHRIMNRSASPTISIHVYGGDIGSQPRHRFELETGHVHPFVSGYDLPGEGA